MLSKELLVKVRECKEVLNDIEDLLVSFLDGKDSCFGRSFSFLFNQQRVENGKTLDDLSRGWILLVVALLKPFICKFHNLFGKD